MDTEKIVNWHGWKLYQDYGRGYGPFFLNTVMQRIHKKKATNVVVTGEIGEGKSYFAMDICRILMGLDKKGEERFSLDQVVFGYKGFMDLILKLPMGYPVHYDEPSYSLSLRTWHQELQRALVLTMESMRFKVHPIFFAITNKSLLDKTIRTHLLQYQITVHGRGRATVYRLHSSQFEDKTFHKYFCDLEYEMLDIDRCNRDSCLDCPKLMECNIFRARYEKKKAMIQDARYSQAKAMAEKTEAKRLSDTQIENLSVLLKNQFVKNGKINVNQLMLALSDEASVQLSMVHAYRIKAMLEKHHPEILET